MPRTLYWTNSLLPITNRLCNRLVDCIGSSAGITKLNFISFIIASLSMHYHPRVRVLKIGNTKPEPQFSDSFIRVMLRRWWPRCFVCTVAFHLMLACVARVHATPQVMPLPKCIKEAQKHSQSQRSIKCIFVVVSIYGKFSQKNESSFTYLQNNMLSRGKNTYHSYRSSNAKRTFSEWFMLVDFM